MKILCTADIHIGRRASRVPDSFEDIGRFTAANAWHDIVRCAIDEKVDLLLIAGDLVDEENRYFESYGPLESGLERLASHGIEAIVVAGNHDVEVLPRVVNRLDGAAADSFHMLGQGGQWERHTIRREGRPVLHIDGWSFPQRHVRQNPLDSYAAFVTNRTDDAPVLVLLHTDLDQRDSPYGPVMSRQLEEHSCDFWLFGHIHLPHHRKLDNGAHFLYPGSPMALDSGESGQHGPWLLTFDGRALSDLHQRPLSRIRYETLSIALDDIHEPDAVQTHIVTELKAALARQITDPGNLELLCARLRFVGRSKLHRQIHELSARLSELELSLHGATVIVEKVENATRPNLDLEALSRQASPVGALVSLLLELEKTGKGNGTPESDRIRHLKHAALKKLNEVHNATAYSALNDGSLPDEEVAEAYLRRAGYALLDALYAQKETS